jgi:predicted nuclease with RNAse H fold
MKENSRIWGIDYGSKLAGTTVIGQLENNTVQLFASQKKKDADKFILQKIEEYQPTSIFIDAPLSLPNVYLNTTGYDDYFYRKSDKIVKGMSPMFLGGLTARAMKMKAILEKKNIVVFETYPALHARHFGLKAMNYKKQKEYLSPIIDYLAKKLPFQFNKIDIVSWHHVDALLATYSAYRFQQGTHETIGDDDEGVIIF